MTSAAGIRDRARHLLLTGDAAGARAEYDRGIEAFPEAAILYAGRGAATGSREDVDRALALDPRCADAWVARARMAGDLRAALGDVEKALEADPGHLPARYWRGIWRSSFGEEEPAEEDLRVVRKGVAEDLLSQQYRAWACVGLGEWKEARSLLDRVIAGGVTDLNLRSLRAWVRSELRDAKGSIKDWTEVLAKYPNDQSALLGRSFAYRWAGYPKEAVRDLERALEQAPDHPAPLYYRAMLRGGLAKSGWSLTLNAAGAREDLAKAAASSHEDPDGFFYRGLAKEELGRIPEALLDYERALPGSAPFPWLRRGVRARIQALKKGEAAAVLPPPLPDVVKVPSISIVVMALNVGIWLAQGDYALSPDPETLVEHGALWRPLVWKGEVWRLFTAMFLHIGPIHLFWNVYAGFGWCGAVERQVGSGRFLLAYVATGLAASATSVLGHAVPAAGASGALFGVVGVAIFSLYHRLGNLRAFFANPATRVMLINIGIWFLIGATVLRMDNYAHGGGLAAGLLFGWLYFKASAWSIPVRAAAWGLSMTALAAYLAFACLPR